MSALPPVPQERPVLVWLSPLPQMRNGIADYAATLLTLLTRRYQIVCVVEDPAVVSPAITALAEVISVQDYARIAPQLAGFRHLAHIGNNRDHTYMIDILSRVPGVVVLHDLTLLYMLECWAEHSTGNARTLVDVAQMLRGGAGLRQTRFKFEGRGPLVSLYSEINCLELLSDIATGVITHSQYGRVLVRTAGYARDIAVIPHFAQAPEPALQARQRRTWRHRLGIPDKAVVFASLGFVSPNKTIDVALEALARLPREAGTWRYIIAGEARDPAVPAAVERLGLGDRVIFLDYLPAEDFDPVLAASDVLINLRFPTSGETSGTVCRALAAGLPAVVSDHGWYAELPANATWRVPPGRNVHAELARTLLVALADRTDREARAAAARAYAARRLALDGIVRQYERAIEAAWQAHGSGLNRGSPGPSGVLTQKPPLSQDTLAPRDLGTTLTAILAHEQVCLAGRSARLEPLPASGGLPVAMPVTDADGPRQLFAALPFAGAVGAVVLSAVDAAAALQPGELLTLALVETGIRTRPQQHPVTPQGARCPPGQDGGTVAERALEDAGFALIRRYKVPVIPDGPDGTSATITVLTARKASLAAPQLAYFGA